jgi:hypothetical protein
MKNEAPLTPERQIDTLAEKVRGYIVEARLKARDGLTVAELSELIVSAMRIAIAALDSIPVDGAQRKEIVIAFVGDMFDEFADKVVPLVAWPFWIVAKPTVRIVALAVASGATEALLHIVRST